MYMCECYENGRQFSKAKNDWRTIKLSRMYGTIVKALEDENLRIALKNTDGKTLIVKNNVCDNYWGRCFCKNCNGEFGYNNLGTLLKSIRIGLKI